MSKEFLILLITLMLSVVFVCGLIYIVTFDSRYGDMEPTKLLDKCEKELPRNRNCVLIAIPAEVKLK